MMITTARRYAHKSFRKGGNPLFAQSAGVGQALRQVSKGTGNSAAWKPLHKHLSSGAVTEPAGCGFLGAVVGAIWFGLWFCSFLCNWWRQSPSSLLAVGIGAGVVILVLSLLGRMRKVVRQKTEVVALPSRETTPVPECVESPEAKPEAEPLRPRTAAQLDVYD
jgi:hypothetical protein